MNKLIISALLGMVVSVNAYADVMVSIDRNLQILAVNGVEPDLSFGHTAQLKLPNGTNQLLMRVEKVIQYSGNQNKYKSPAMVVKFNQENSQVLVKPASIVKDETTAKAFDKNPAVVLTNLANQPVEFEQDVLVTQGFSLIRNYEKELYRYNSQAKEASVSALNQVGFNQKRSAAEPVLAAATQTPEPMTAAEQVEPVASTSSPTSLTMVQYLYSEATRAEQQEFANWAFANRAEVAQPMVTQNKLVEMMADWYKKADKAEKASILSWLISQE
ncbi:DUF2057 domain-containing protein [Vibrio cholerae]|uniref:YccT family protein n=1 Tax=Vibrio cholerae TaxID=666 RepID=UPI000F0BA85B|nr:DUF2057 domain-containing protein [Vibrio cholerae]RNE71783.1 DUF2057 domain-containing protein [Vibrio cholerae]